MSANSATQYYRHGHLKVSGGSLPDAVTAYRTYGDPNSPCIIISTCFGVKLDGLEPSIGKDKALDPSKYFIVAFAMFANGESSSPSNTAPPFNGPSFPAVSYEDNVLAQHAVLTKGLGVTKLFCVIGFSMGAQQAFYWSIMFRDFVDRFVSICGSARTNAFTRSVLDGAQAALKASEDFKKGHYETPVEIGIRAFARVSFPWTFSPGWFTQQFEGTDASAEDFVREHQEGFFYPAWDANDLLVLQKTWQNADVSKIRTTGGFTDLRDSLSAIKAKGLLLTCNTDFYFPVNDSESEVSMLTNGKLVVVDSIWGHMAGFLSPKDALFLDAEIEKFFSE